MNTCAQCGEPKAEGSEHLHLEVVPLPVFRQEASVILLRAAVRRAFIYGHAGFLVEWHREDEEEVRCLDRG